VGHLDQTFAGVCGIGTSFERWFGLITQQAIRRGSFRKVPDLVAKVEAFTTHYNEHSPPFAWTATADSILKKIERLCRVISGTGH